MAPSALEAGLSALDDDVSVVTDIEDDNTTIATAVDPNAEAEAERANTAWDIAVGDGQQLSAKENAMLRLDNENNKAEIDRKSRVEAPMHESIERALLLYVTILRHPSRTSKVCELALECIRLLVANGYISGRAGGRDDPTGSGSQAIAQAESPACCTRLWKESPAVAITIQRRSKQQPAKHFVP